MSPKDVLKQIWLKPRAVMGYWLDAKKDTEKETESFVFTLAALASLSHAVQKTVEDSKGDDIALGMLPVIWIIAAVLWGPLGLLFNAWMYGHVGKLVTGQKRDTYFLRAALAFGNIPFIFVLVPIGVLFALLGGEVFQTQMPRLDASPNLAYPVIALTVACLVLVCWSWVTTSHTLAEVYGVSAWKGLFIQLVPYLVAVAGALVILYFSNHSIRGALQAILKGLT